MGTSSARPANLEDFASKSRHADGELQSDLGRLMGAYRSFQSENQWGTLDAESLLSAFHRYINGNAFTARWVAQIAAAFRSAGGRGAIRKLPDAAIKASLRSAGLDHDRNSVTFDGPVAYGAPPTTGYTNDPVNTATGNFVEVEEDLVFGGLVEGLSFRRTYNSRSERIGPFGRGWSSWSTTRLATREDGAEYVGPDGQEAFFPRMGAGYGRIVEVGGLVEPLASGLALNWFGGRGRWEFDDAGRLVSVSQGPGTRVTLRHDEEGRLVELAHAGGRQLALHWDDAGERIARLACSDGRGVSYGYDDLGNLVSADGEDGIRRYAYDGGGRIASVTDADGVVELVNTYDDDGRVLEQLSPFGRHTYLSYLPGRVTVTSDDDEDGPVNTYIHDGEGRLLAIVDGDDRQLSMSYDQWGNRISLTERNGAVTIQAYDDRARATRRVLPTGVAVSFTHDDADRLLAVELSTGAVTRYRYEGEERSPVEIIDAEGATTRQTVRDGLVHRIVDPDGVALDLEFDADGNLIAATDGGGHTTRVERDSAGRMVATVTPLGRRSTFVYDTLGRIAERIDPSGAAWRMEYTAAGRLASMTDPLGGREEIRYGRHGEATALVDALGHETVHDYDAFGNVVGVRAADGTRSEYVFDALMRLVATVDPAGARWERRYDVSGALVATVDPTGTQVRIERDAFGRVAAVDDGGAASFVEHDELGRVTARRDPNGAQVRAEYDHCGRNTVLQESTGAITRFAYTPGGRLAKRVSPSGAAEVFEHDACGRVAARTDGAGRRWSYRYDADGEITEIELPTGECEHYDYDECGRLRTWAVPGAGVTSCERDRAGRVVSVTERETGRRRVDLDAVGRPVAVTDANGATTRCEYDQVGRLGKVVDPLGGVVTRRYDAAGRMVEIVDQLGRSAALSYDAAGRLVGIADGSGREVKRSYDGSGRLKSFGAQGEDPITIEYDAIGRIVGVDEPGSLPNRLRWNERGRLVERRRGELALRWDYDDDDRRAAIGYPDGTRTTLTRDAGGYVIGAHHPVLGAIDLERDGVGRLISARAEGMSAQWRYDDGDLAQYELRAGSVSRSAQLTRDPLGRIAHATIDGEAYEFGYDAAGQLVAAQTPAGRYAFGYDPNGRLARESSPSGVAACEHDAAGQLSLRSAGNGDQTRYEYDGAGRRVRESGALLDRTYRWDELGRLTAVERAATGEQEPATVDVVVDALGELAALDGTPLLWDSADPLGPLCWNGQGAVVGEGSPWAIAGDDGAQWLAPDWMGSVGSEPRDPWGAPVVPGAASGGLRLGFRGEVEFDAEVWLRHRVYQPASRAFLQPDELAPITGTAVAANPYHYAANNAIALSDPLGLRPVTDKELQALRDSMDRGALDHAADAVKAHVQAQIDAVKAVGTFVYEHASEISLALGVVAMVCPALAPVLGPVALGLSLLSAQKSFRDGDIVGGVLDMAGAVPAVGGVVKVAKAGRAANTAKQLRATRSAASEALYLAERRGTMNVAELTEGYAKNQAITARIRDRERLSQAFLNSAQTNDVHSLGFGVVGLHWKYREDLNGLMGADPVRQPLGVP